MLPRELLELDHKSKAFVIASIQITAEDNKKAIAKAERKAKR